MPASCSLIQLNFQSREEKDISVYPQFNFKILKIYLLMSLHFDESLSQASSYKYPEDAKEEHTEN